MEQTLNDQFAQWLETVPGRYVRAWEQAGIDAEVVNTFGYHAIQIGLPHWDLLAHSRISCKVCTAQAGVLPVQQKNLVYAEPEHLPFDTQSIDLLILPHTLESASDPHQVLREAERVLVPEGRIILTGFNPLSLWGAHDWIPGLERGTPTLPGDVMSPLRLRDWLKLLSFDVQGTQMGCYAPLCRQQVWLDRWSWMEQSGARWWSFAGAVYMISAVKRTPALRMVGPKWKKNRRRVRRPMVVAGRAADEGISKT